LSRLGEDALSMIQQEVPVRRSDERFDPREMQMVHAMLRREFALAPAVIRTAATGSRHHAGVVVQHLNVITTVLHHHHQAEDDYVWPLLTRRCPVAATAMVELMEMQHRRLAVLVDAVNSRLSSWKACPSTESLAVLADSMDRLLPVLNDHLDMEEECVVPLMAHCITAAEWNAMVARGVAEADPGGLLLGFGMLIYEGDHDLVDAAIANMPEDVRPAIREQAEHAFAEHSRRVHGTETPLLSTDLVMDRL
jgi:iron-sulfur cluster repair protein YtfE (RIC family)